MVVERVVGLVGGFSSVKRIDTMDLMEVTRIMTAVAWQADKVEEKLTGGDEY